MELKNNNFKRQIQNTDFQQAENKQLIFSVADQLPYLRHDQYIGDYYEVLEISEDAIDTTRLVKNMPFLKDHDRSAQLGAVKKFWIKDKKLYVSVKFSRSRFAQSIKEDIIDLIRQNTSVGYFVNQFKRTGQIDGIPVLRAVSWTPYECSSVSVPASVFVGYNRSIEIKQKGQDMNAQTNKTNTASELDKEELEGKEKESNLDLEDKNVAVEDLERKSEEATEVEEETEKEKELCPECNKPLEQCECEKKSEEEPKEEEKNCGGSMKPQEKSLDDVKIADLERHLKEQIEKDAIEIRSLGELAGEQESAEEYITQKRSLDQFKTYLKNKNSEKSKNSIQEENKMEKKYFSIVHAINNARNHNTNPEDYENKVIADNKRTLNITENADIIMTNNELYFKRAFNDGTTMSGGSQLIQPDYLPQEFVPFDRPQLTIDKVGGYSIPSNGQPISFTQCVSGATASMYTINGELSGGDMDFVLKQMTPHKCGCYIPIPYDLLLEGRPDIDSIVQADIVNALYQKRDEQIWTGDGTGNNVAGIQSLTGINIISGAANTSISSGLAWGAMLSGVGAIRKANIFNENISYVMNTDTYITLKKTMKDKNNCMGGWIIEDDKIGNYPVYVNNAVSANTVLVGVGSDIAVTDFRGLGMIVDPYTYSTKQSLRVTAWISFDMVLRREKAWTKIILEA